MQLLDISLTQKQIGEFVLFGIIGILGFFWQIITMQKDSEREGMPFRVFIPFCCGVLFILGTIVWGIFAINNDEKKLTFFADVQDLVIKEFVLFTTFMLKSYLGPICAAATICMLLFYQIEFGKFEVASWVSLFFDWLFGKVPKWVETVYIIVLTANVLLGSLLDSHSSISEKIP